MRERGDARGGRHRLVDVEQVELLAPEQAGEGGSSASWLSTMCVRELFAGTVTVVPIEITREGRLSRRPASGVQQLAKRAGRVVAHDQPRLEADPLERLGLRLGVLADPTDVGPRERNDDAHFHGNPGGSGTQSQELPGSAWAW